MYPKQMNLLQKMGNQNNICWVLQKNLTPEPILEQMKVALQVQNVDFQEVTVIPFSDELPDGIDFDRFNIFYGSTTLMMNAYNREQLRRGVFYEPELFTMRSYIKHWGEKMFNANAQFFSFEELVAQDLVLESQWFIRPNGDTKAFSGTIMSFGEIKEWYKRVTQFAEGAVQASTEVVIAPPRIPDKEWRCFVVDQQMVTSCRYAQGGELAVNLTDAPEEMLSFVQDCVKKYTPHPIFVMDVALYQEEYYLLECGCMNSTGFYKAEVASVLAAINAFFAQ